MKRFNISEWGLRHPALVLYFMVALTLVGLLAYSKLGQSEDPPFTFKVMVVRTAWPGASAQEVERQITEKIEKTLQSVPYADIIRSYSRPGESMIFFQAKDATPAAAVPGHLVPGAQEGGRHALHAAQGHRGPHLQRRVRRRCTAISTPWSATVSAIRN